MKNNGRVIKNAVFVFIIILISIVIVWLVDRELHGIFKEWLLKRFIIDDRYPNGRVGVVFNSWSQLKQFIINVFFFFVLILGLLTSISSYLYSNYKSKKDITFISDLMNSFVKSNDDDLTLPMKYSEIETQLIKLKTISLKNQQLVQIEMQRKNDLITYLAHDLKTPLASVIGYLSLLDETPDLPIEQKAKYLRIALDKAYRLEELINEFFDITRFNLQSIVLNKSKIKLSFMLQQMVDEFYPMLEPQGKKAYINVRDDLVMVADADKIARVFNNILKNAIAYSYENSVIDISAIKRDENIIVAFTNQGEPIPPHRLETIFEKFYRLDFARSANTGGAGLGLAIAKEIVDAHNGKLTVESNIEFTRFTVMIPS